LESVGAPPFFGGKGAPTKVNLNGSFLEEVPIIQTQRKKKKKCIAAIQEKGLFLCIGGGGIE